MVSSAQPAVAFANAGGSAGAATDLRADVASALERLSQAVVGHSSRDDPRVRGPAGLKQVQEAVRFLGQVVAAWNDIHEEALPDAGAGFGSTVVVEDVDRGVRDRFTLMAGPLLDIDAGQVSLASPVGQALLGAEVGDVVRVQTPQRLRTLRVVALRTLRDVVAEHSPTRAA